MTLRSGVPPESPAAKRLLVMEDAANSQAQIDAAVPLVGEVAPVLHHASRRRPSKGAESVEEQLFKVEGMTCDHCVAAVEQEVRGVAGARDVSVQLADGTLTIAGDGVDPAAVRAAVEEAGYTLA